MSTAQENEKIEWISLSYNNYHCTAKTKVNGGYLYNHVVTNDDDEISSSMCFVPDIDLTRYQAHLRDAYKQGYEAGHQDAKNGIKED